MKNSCRVAFLTCSLCSLISCNTGFQLSEEDENDTVYTGPSADASWRLVLDEDGESFRLQKRTAPSSESNIYSLRGSYATLDTGFTEFTVTAGSATEVTTSELPAIKIGDDSFVMFPFTDNQSELIALVPTDTCPATDVRGNSLFLDRDSDTSDAATFWLSAFRYDVSQNTARYSSGTALDNNFSLLGDQDFVGAACADGVAEDTDGDHYLTTRAAIIEIRNFFADDDYSRTLTTRSRVISDILDMDSENYVGFVHYQGQPEESYFVSASCDNGICIVFREEEYNELTFDVSVYELEFDQTNLNYQSINGAAVGSIIDGNDQSGRVACTLNSNVGSTNTKFIMCNAQAPDDNTSLVTMLLIDGNS